MYYEKLLNEFVTVAKNTMGEQLTGIYLHGSMAMGCFNPEKSDIDLIVVIEKNISDEQKMEFMRHVIILNQKAPAKGLEISIVEKTYCQPFLYPTPFELHFSPAHLQWFADNPESYIENMKGEDKDLAAHFTIINKYGIVLYGEEINKVFGAVPKGNYLDSIYFDIENAPEEIMEEPIYITLNLCRVLAFLKQGLYLSKEEGGKWGMEHLPACYHDLLSDALECYATNKNMSVDGKIARMFAEEMLNLVKERKGCQESAPF